mmetsp:Transcript_32598/g.77488  ORF Transcript_32598/g.77488 Transcript_32598/m.77488 type:complete len:134 (+) Transcript_32598:215-616(+)
MNSSVQQWTAQSLIAQSSASRNMFGLSPCKLESVDAKYGLYIDCKKTGLFWNSYKIVIVRADGIEGPVAENVFTFEEDHVEVQFHQMAAVRGNIRRVYQIDFCGKEFQKVREVIAIGGVSKDKIHVWKNKVGC